MAAFLVAIVVSDPDEDTARRLAESVANLAAEAVHSGKAKPKRSSVTRSWS